MANRSKSVRVTRHRRSPAGSPPYKGSGAKPGPKTVRVTSHRRRPPK